MSRQFTIEQVRAHNLNENNPPKNWHVVIHGEVYRVGSIPMKKCPINTAAIVAKLVGGPDASDLFVTEHMDGKTVEVLKSAQGCHVGTIVKAPAGGQQGQLADHAQQGPGQQEQNANHGQHGQNDGHVQNEQNRQPNDDDGDDDGWTGAERRRREEARKRRLRKAYNPLKQDPDDADEYPADAVAMGYLPDLDGRRWRERRMRLSRFIQYNDSPAVEEEDLDPIATSLLDMDFAKEIWYKRNLKGGEAKRCTGSFQAARPPPPRSQLRPRPGTADPSGGHHHHHHQPPPPRDLPDSDADDDDGDDDNAPGAPAVRAQVQLEARVREWFPSNSNRTVLHLATPPVTPQTNPAQQTVRPPIQPPAPPPQQSQQRSREEEEEISKQRQAREHAELQEVLRKQQKNQADKPEATGTGLETPQNTQRPTETGGKRTRKVTDGERAKQSAQRREETRKKEQEKRRKQKEEDELKRQKAEEDAKKKREEDAKKKQKEEEDKLKRQKEQEEAQKKDAAKRANVEPGKRLEGQALEDARKQMQETMREKAEQVNRENQEEKERELQEGKDSQAAIEKQYRTRQQERFTAQQARIQDYMNKGYNLRQATTVVRGFQGGLVEDPNKKRPAETTQEDQGPSKRRKDETQQDKKGQAGGGSSSSSSKFDDKSRPWKAGEEPWTKPTGAGQSIGFGAEDLLDDDEDWGESADELAAPGVTAGTQPSTRGGGGGAAQTPHRDVPDLPSDVPPRGNTTTAGASHTPQNAPAQSQGYGTVPPATGWPTKGTTAPAPNTTRSSRSGRRSRPGLAPGAQIPDDIKKLMKEHAREK